jgi:hypothetical protein
VKGKSIGTLEQVTACKSIRTTYQTTDLLEEYVNGAYPNLMNAEAGPSNEPKRARV